MSRTRIRRVRRVCQKNPGPARTAVRPTAKKISRRVEAPLAGVQAKKLAVGSADDQGNLRLREAKAGGSGAETLVPNEAASIQALHGGGRSLHPVDRDFFAPRLPDLDLDRVRVHSDKNSQRLARSLDSRAFTFENNIVLGEGEYAPGVESGRRLLAHELAHVAQQTPIAAGGTIRRQETTAGKTIKLGGTVPSLDLERSFVRVARSDGEYRSTRGRFTKEGNYFRAHNVQAEPGDVASAQLFDTSGRVFGASAKVGSGPNVVLDVAAPKLTERSQDPKIDDIIYVPGTGAAASLAEVKSQLRAKTAGSYVSLGRNGRIILEFDPPLMYRDGFTTLATLDEHAYEGIHVTLGNNPPVDGQFSLSGVDLPRGPFLQPGVLHGRSSRGMSNPHATNEFRIDKPAGAERQTFRYAQILDKNTPINSTPGIDITSVRGNVLRTVTNITVLLDLSGSMSDDLARDYERNRRVAPQGRRLYQIAADLVVKNLLPRSPFYRYTTRAAAFYAAPGPDAGERKAIIRERLDRPGYGPVSGDQAIENLESVRTQAGVGFRDYTPLAFAMRTAARDVRGAPSAESHHLVVIITDGEGSENFQQNLAAVSANTRDPQMRVGSKSANLELVGFKVKPGERSKFLTFQPAGQWALSAYDADSRTELGAILSGIKAKYNLLDA